MNRVGKKTDGDGFWAYVRGYQKVFGKLYMMKQIHGARAVTKIISPSTRWWPPSFQTIILFLGGRIRRIGTYWTR